MKIKKHLPCIPEVIPMLCISLLICILPFAFWPLRALPFYGALFMLFDRLMRTGQARHTACRCHADSSSCCGKIETVKETDENHSATNYIRLK